MTVGKSGERFYWVVGESATFRVLTDGAVMKDPRDGAPKRMLGTVAGTVVNRVQEIFGHNYYEKLRDDPSAVAEEAKLEVLEILARFYSNK